MRKLIATSLLVLGAAAPAFAIPVPEIDAGSSIGAVGLIAGAILVLRARRKK